MGRGKHHTEVRTHHIQWPTSTAVQHAQPMPKENLHPASSKQAMRRGSRFALREMRCHAMTGGRTCIQYAIWYLRVLDTFGNVATSANLTVLASASCAFAHTQAGAAGTLTRLSSYRAVPERGAIDLRGLPLAAPATFPPHHPRFCRCMPACARPALPAFWHVRAPSIWPTPHRPGLLTSSAATHGASLLPWPGGSVAAARPALAAAAAPVCAAGVTPRGEADVLGRAVRWVQPPHRAPARARA